jgi:Beta-galactosidase
VRAGDLSAWRRFLRTRYRQPAGLNAAWGVAAGDRIASFGELSLPVTLPDSGARLLDWIQFVSLAIPSERRAHRFTVLVPVRPEEGDEERAQRIGRVERVVRLEKPAHTEYEVRSFWAAWRVGEARVGHETVVGEGSRFMALVLGAGRLAAVYVSARSPWEERDRMILGRDRVRASQRPLDGPR